MTCGFMRTSASLPVLLVGDLLHPLDVLAVARLLDGDVGHAGRRCRAMPMPEPRRKPDDVPWPDLLDRSAVALNPTQPRGDDQGLAERMRVPGCPGTRLECDLACASPRRIWCLKQRIHTDRSGEPVW